MPGAAVPGATATVVVWACHNGSGGGDDAIATREHFAQVIHIEHHGALFDAVKARGNLRNGRVVIRELQFVHLVCFWVGGWG